MTKTTSYEISKKLKEAGFTAETEYYWHSINDKIELLHVARAELGDVKAYDLETILDALKQTGKRIMIDVENDYWVIYFNHESYKTILVNNKYSQDESLADTAGRMWLMLKEKGLIC